MTLFLFSGKRSQPAVEIGGCVINATARAGRYYEKDARVLRIDNNVKKIFNLSDDVNKVTDHRDKSGLTIFTLQTHIKHAYDDFTFKRQF